MLEVFSLCLLSCCHSASQQQEVALTTAMSFVWENNSSTSWAATPSQLLPTKWALPLCASCLQLRGINRFCYRDVGMRLCMWCLFFQVMFERICSLFHLFFYLGSILSPPQTSFKYHAVKRIVFLVYNGLLKAKWSSYHLHLWGMPHFRQKKQKIRGEGDSVEIK